MIGDALPCDGVLLFFVALAALLLLAVCIQVLPWPFVGAFLKLCDELGRMLHGMIMCRVDMLSGLSGPSGLPIFSFAWPLKVSDIWSWGSW